MQSVLFGVILVTTAGSIIGKHFLVETKNERHVGKEFGQDYSDTKDTKDAKDTKVTKDTKNTKETKDIKNIEDTKDTKNTNETKETKDSKEYNFADYEVAIGDDYDEEYYNGDDSTQAEDYIMS